MELNLFFLVPLLQCTSIDRCALFMRAKQKKIILLCLVIKILPLAPFFFFHSFITSCLSLSLLFTLISSLKLISLKLTLSTLVSQAPSFTVAGSTHPQRHHYRSSTSPTHQPSQAADQPQTHAAICLRPLSSIGVLARGYWVPNWETHGARRPTPSVDPAC